MKGKMKKSFFYYLFAVVCTACLFTACSDDDDDDKKNLTIDNIVGTYPGDIDVKLAGSEVISDYPVSISVVKVSDSKVKVTLPNFSIPGTVAPVPAESLKPVDITVECSAVLATDEFKLTGSGTVDLTEWGLDVLPVTVSGDADGTELDLDIAVAAMKVVVDFDGRK